MPLDFSSYSILHEHLMSAHRVGEAIVSFVSTIQFIKAVFIDS